MCSLLGIVKLPLYSPMSPTILLSKVDLPAPLGPKSPRPRLIERCAEHPTKEPALRRTTPEAALPQLRSPLCSNLISSTQGLISILISGSPETPMQAAQQLSREPGWTAHGLQLLPDSRIATLSFYLHPLSSSTLFAHPCSVSEAGSSQAYLEKHMPNQDRQDRPRTPGRARGLRQLLHPQAPDDQDLTRCSPAVSHALHADVLVVDQSGRTTLRRSHPRSPPALRPPQRASPRERSPCLGRRMEREPPALHLDQDHRRHPRLHGQIPETN